MSTIAAERPYRLAPLEPPLHRFTRSECSTIEASGVWDQQRLELAKPSQEFRAGNPQPADLRLVVEIFDSTLGFDLTVKADLYARAGITEY